MQSTEDKTYNGWTNYETWAVGLYLDGNYDGEGTYRYVLELVGEAAQAFNADNVEAGIWTEADARKFAVEDALKSWFEETLPELDGIAADLLGAATSEINWLELAQHKLDEIAEES